MEEQSEKLSQLRSHLDYLLKKSGGRELEKGSSDPEKVKSQILRLETSLRNMEVRKKLKSDNKSIALTTSKVNYMDPRISVSWCKLKQVPIEKIYNRSILVKFPWAMEVDKGFVW
jgi:DNA topoisomerase-1